MRRMLKVIGVSALAAGIPASIFWGFLVQGLNCWGTYMNSCTAQDMGLWPFIFWFVVPAVLIIATFSILRKK